MAYMELEVVTGSYDSLVQGFSIDALDPESEGLKRKFHEKDHCGCVRAVACGGRYLATGGTDETIKLYDMRKHTEMGTLLQQEGSITWLAFHKDRLLLSASEDGTICVWKCGGRWDCLATLTGHKYAVTCVSVHPSGKLALSVGKDRTVRTWDLTSFRAAFRLRLPKAAELVLWSPIGDQYVLSVGKDVSVYDVSSGDLTVTFDVGSLVNCFAFIQDNVVAVGSEHSSIGLYSTVSGSLLASLQGHTNRVKGLALSPAADLLFSASSDGTVKAWKLREPLCDSSCFTSLESGSRLTCLTLVCPDSLLKELKQPSLQQLSGVEESTSQVEETSQRTETQLSRSCKKRTKSMEECEEERDGSSPVAGLCLHGNKKNRKVKRLGRGVAKSGKDFELKAKPRKLSRRRDTSRRAALLMRKKQLLRQTASGRS